MGALEELFDPGSGASLPGWLAGVDTRWVLLACLVVLNAWCVSLVAMSDAGTRERWLWTGVIVLCPVVGCILWFVLGPKPRLVEEAGEGS